MKNILASLILTGLAAFALTSCCCDYDSGCDPCPQGSWRPCPEPRPQGCPRPHFWDRCSNDPSNYEY